MYVMFVSFLRPFLHSESPYLNTTFAVGLAYVTAATHGLTEEAAALAEKLGDEVPEVPSDEDTELLIPMAPIMRQHETNWPLLTVSTGYFDPSVLESGDKLRAAQIADEDEEDTSAWDQGEPLDAGLDEAPEGGYFTLSHSNY